MIRAGREIGCGRAIRLNSCLRTADRPIDGMVESNRQTNYDIEVTGGHISVVRFLRKLAVSTEPVLRQSDAGLAVCVSCNRGLVVIVAGEISAAESHPVGFTVGSPLHAHQFNVASVVPPEAFSPSPTLVAFARVFPIKRLKLRVSVPPPISMA